MNKDVLMEILHKLVDLQENLLLAYQTKDKRSRPKTIREAEEKIIRYADFIPLESEFSINL